METKLCQMGMNEGQEGWDGCGLVYLKYFLGRSSVDFESAGDQDVASTEKTLRGTGPGWANSSGLTHGDIHPAELLRYKVARYLYKRDQRDARVGTLDYLEKGPGGDQEGTRRGPGGNKEGAGSKERGTRSGSGARNQAKVGLTGGYGGCSAGSGLEDLKIFKMPGATMTTVLVAAGWPPDARRAFCYRQISRAHDSSVVLGARSESRGRGRGNEMNVLEGFSSPPLRPSGQAKCTPLIQLCRRQAARRGEGGGGQEKSARKAGSMTAVTRNTERRPAPWQYREGLTCHSIIPDAA